MVPSEGGPAILKLKSLQQHLAVSLKHWKGKRGGAGRGGGGPGGGRGSPPSSYGVRPFQYGPALALSPALSLALCLGHGKAMQREK